MVGSAFAPIGNLGSMNGTTGLGNLSYGRILPSNVYDINVPLSEAFATMGNNINSLKGGIYDPNVPLSQGFFGTKAIPNVITSNGSNIKFPSYISTPNMKFNNNVQSVAFKDSGVQPITPNANANNNNNTSIFGNAGNWLGAAQSIAGLVGGLTDIFTGIGAYRQNKKNMKLQREAMQYNLDRTRSENKRLDNQRADVTKSWNNGQVM